ncbi:MAG TPA: nucleotidyltransferase domain-containing protein [Longimicrobiales bacterium]|nr:nucleotidyltransferase domain-containing protein [Longimicrobiales bacterium]
MADPVRLAETFVDEFAESVGDRIRAAALFGSAARGEWVEGVSDVNVVVLVDRIDGRLLERGAPAAKAAVGRGLTPLLMAVDEWGRAADVFAIELADMRDACRTLRGDDPAASASFVQPSLLRLQAERELRAKLVHLHAGMLMGADDHRRLGQLLVHALPSFATYLRAALRLAGDPVPPSMAGVITAGCALVGADAAPVLDVNEARTGGNPFEVRLGDGIADEFNTAAEQLAAYIDAFGR